MIPPTTTGASTASAWRARMTSGTSSRCEPERIERPTTSTSSSRAATAIWVGVSRMPWYTTSMPASRAATAICSAPFEWPSRPGLPTSIRGGPPSSADAAFTRARTASMSSSVLVATPPTPVGARYSPKTSRSAPAHSPTVPPTRASSIVAGIRFASVAAVSWRSSSAARPRCRHARTASARATRSAPPPPRGRARGCAPRLR